ncbi:hypothetical protein SDC9_13382 [bioreactor metagenome]|uniref:Uncharacterized protein n=1 Tax=bioreactor metagenome TaxID=1076179 RepID=A0A644TLC4_9ZZZZ
MGHAHGGGNNHHNSRMRHVLFRPKTSHIGPYRRSGKRLKAGDPTIPAMDSWAWSRAGPDAEAGGARKTGLRVQ